MCCRGLSGPGLDKIFFISSDIIASVFFCRSRECLCEIWPVLLRGNLLILLCSGNGPRLAVGVYGHLSDVLELGAHPTGTAPLK